MGRKSIDLKRAKRKERKAKLKRLGKYEGNYESPSNLDKLNTLPDVNTEQTSSTS